MRRACSQETRDAITALVDALAMQLAARVPLYWDHTGTVLVPLHPLLDTVELTPLLEGTALTLLHPRTCTLATGATVLMVPLGEALAVLPFSRHFPDALAQVTRLEALQAAAETHPEPSTRA
jgi:hypothetical protein